MGHGIVSDTIFNFFRVAEHVQIASGYEYFIIGLDMVWSLWCLCELIDRG